MILSSYLRELSVEANKRRNNNKELLNLVPNIDFYSTSKRTFTEKKELPKKEIKMKKKKGLMEIIDDKKEEKQAEEPQEKEEKEEQPEEPQEKEEQQEAGSPEKEEQQNAGSPEKEEQQEAGSPEKEEQQNAGSPEKEEQQNAGGDNIKRIFIKEPQEGGEPPPKDNQVKNITVTSFF